MESDINKRNLRKNIIIVGSIIIVAIIALAVFYKLGIRPKKEAVSFPPAPEIKTVSLPIDKLSDVFPKDIILNKGDQILESYESDIVGSGKKEYVLKFGTNKTPREIFTQYFKYSMENKWAMADNGVSKDGSSSFFEAVNPKEGKTIQISSIASPLVTSGSIVTVTITTYEKFKYGGN